MANKSTYIKLDRNIMRWRWYQNANTFRVFMHCLLSANVRECDFEGVKIGRGEFATTYGKISLFLGDVSQKQVLTAIKHLKRSGELAVKIYPKYQVITVLNYNLYQGCGQANGQAAVSQRSGRGQQSKNNKNKKNIYNIPPLTPPMGAETEQKETAFDIFWKSYPKKQGKADARKVFEKIQDIENLLPVMLTAIADFKKTPDWTKDGGRYVPMPATWLRGERWNDEITVQQSQAEKEPPTKTKQKGSFDSDEFFQAALRSSYVKCKTS